MDLAGLGQVISKSLPVVFRVRVGLRPINHWLYFKLNTASLSALGYLGRYMLLRRLLNGSRELPLDVLVGLLVVTILEPFA